MSCRVGSVRYFASLISDSGSVGVVNLCEVIPLDSAVSCRFIYMNIKSNTSFTLQTLAWQCSKPVLLLIPHFPILIGMMIFPLLRRLIVTVILLRRKLESMVLLVLSYWRWWRGGVVIPTIPAVPHATVVSLFLSVCHVHSPLGHLQSENDRNLRWILKRKHKFQLLKHYNHQAPPTTQYLSAPERVKAWSRLN